MPAGSIAETSLTDNAVRRALFRSSGIAPGRPDLVTLSGIAASPGGPLAQVDHVAFHYFECVTIAILAA
jgi:hypothetical protein